MTVNERIALGTVQFGLKYGINNTAGQVSYTAAREIAAYYCNEVTTPVFDTASAYGESEEVLGRILRELDVEQRVRIISKFPVSVTTGEALRASFERTLGLLHTPRLYGFLAHDADTIRKYPDVYHELIRVKEEGGVGKIGVSAYHPAQIQWLIDQGLPIDLIQVPYNVLDRRFEPFLSAYKNAGIEIHTRSAFLQGLFFTSPDSLHGFFNPVKEHLSTIRSLAAASGLALNKLLLLFCLNQPGIDRVVIGVDSVQNIRDNMLTGVDVHNYRKVSEEMALERAVAEEILLPFNWPK